MLKFKEVQQHLNCSASTLKRLLAGGQLEFVRIGPRAIRITEAALEEFVRLNSVRRAQVKRIQE